jgi:hypothetical protein
MNNLPVD